MNTLSAYNLELHRTTLRNRLAEAVASGKVRVARVIKARLAELPPPAGMEAVQETVLEASDREEREAGGKWRESSHLLPGEEVIPLT